MNVLLILVGFFGFCVSLVLLIIKAIKKQPKKNTVIALIVCFILFFIGGAITDTSDVETSSNQEQAQTEEKEDPAQVEEPKQEEQAQTEESTEANEPKQEEQAQTEETAQVAKTAQKAETEQKDSYKETTASNAEETAQTNGIRNESLNGRGNSDTGRNEPDYINVIGYAVVSYDEEHELKDTDDFQNMDYWKIPTYEKDKQIWNKTEISIPHKTEVIVKEQYLEHEGWGNYSGYLLIETLEDGEQYYIDVTNFITKPYWTYTDDLHSAASVGYYVAEFKQVSDYYPVNSDGEKVDIPDGTIVLVTDIAGVDDDPDPQKSGIEGIYWKEWKYGYGGVGIYFNSEDLTIIY